MNIKIIDELTFDTYSKNHILKSFYQTSSYGEVMRSFDYTPLYVALYNESDEIVGASLILTKKLGASLKYGYAPRGFLINYYDSDLLSIFTKKIKDFLSKKSYVFIKINPEITLASINSKSKDRKIYKKNSSLVYLFQELEYYKLRDNIYFESLLPRFNPVIQLPDFTLGSIEIGYRKNIEKNLNRGIKLIKGEYKDLEFFDKFLQKRDKKVLDSYKDYFREFSKNNLIDILLLEIDLKDYLEYLTSEYQSEFKKNEVTNKKLTDDPSNTTYYSVKIVSDTRLNDLNTEIRTLNAKVAKGSEKEIIGASLIIKYEGRINVLEVATNETFSYLETKQFLYYKLIQRYKKKGYTFLDMNGITGDFSEGNPYVKLNEFKESFNPLIYEYIGEFDLIINKALYQYLLSSNKLSKEFEKIR